MNLPERIFLQLSRLVLSSYETRTLMIILHKTYGSDRNTAKITLDEFVEETGIKKPHISRALSHLLGRNVIERIGNPYEYRLQKDASLWRSILSVKLPNGVKVKYSKDFESWWGNYPSDFQIYKVDARILYLNLINDGVKPIELDEALLGMLKYKIWIANRMNKDRNNIIYPYPTSFLRNDKWKDFRKYKDIDPRREFGE